MTAEVGLIPICPRGGGLCSRMRSNRKREEEPMTDPYERCPALRITVVPKVEPHRTT
jgi:hypothetical protein